MKAVELNIHELKYAAYIGRQRQDGAVEQNRLETHRRADMTGDDDHIFGACGELAVAKALGIYYLPTVNTYKQGYDVGAYQVRARRADWHQLQIRKDDQDGQIFILVRGLAPTFQVVGWMRAREARNHEEWYSDPNGRGYAYWVPNDSLHDLADLPSVQSELAAA